MSEIKNRSGFWSATIGIIFWEGWEFLILSKR